MTTKQPFLFRYPKQILNLFWAATVTCPNGRRWGFTFTPGMSNSIAAFKRCLTGSKSCFKWAWGIKGHFKIIKYIWKETKDVRTVSTGLIRKIPQDYVTAGTNIVVLWSNTPFGWLFRIGKIVVWNCICWVCLKFVFGVVGSVILFPLTFMILFLSLCVPKFLIGNVCGVVMSVVSLFPLICGTVWSGLVALTCIPNRFPKDSDNGTYGIYRLN